MRHLLIVYIATLTVQNEELSENAQASTNDESEQMEELKAENEVLTKKIDFLQEENERQKQQLIDSQKEKELAQKSARKSKIFAWFSLGASILIGVLGLIF